MKKHVISRRKFIGSATLAAIGSAVFGIKNVYCKSDDSKISKDIVSIIRVRDGNIQRAVEEA